jgi:hypothetical protein
MSNNFLQWNPAAVNQQTDGAYATDPMRTGGAVSGIFPAELANKLFFQCTTMVSAFAEALSNKGYNMSDADISTLITALSNVLTKADFGTTAGTVCQGNDGRFIPAGTKMWFYQSTAPSGWTIDNTPSDAVLAVKGGSGAYNVVGGMQAGTWSQPTHTHTGPLHSHSGPSHTHTGPSHNHSILSHTHGFSGGSHTHTTGDCTLTAAQSGVPAHSHFLLNPFYPQIAGTGMDGGYWGTGPMSGNSAYYPQTNINTTQNASAAHNHGATGAASFSGTTGGSTVENTGLGGSGNTGAAGTGNTGNGGNGATGASASATTWRPLAQVGIICVKS